MAAENLPKVSCLLITADRDAFAQCAIDCYESQTYPHKELIIVDSGAKPLDLTARLGRIPVTYHRVTSKLSLGELRNLALSMAEGEYFIQWDDDDYSSPSRIRIQYEHAREKCASVLRRVTLMWPARRYSAISKARFWEGTLMARCDLNLSFPALRHAEDTPVIESMIRTRIPFGIVDQPELYYYIFHGSNTSSPQHFAKLCAYPSVTSIRFRDSFRKLPANLKRVLIACARNASQPLEAVAAPK